MAITVETKVGGTLVNTNTTPTPTADAVPVADGAGYLGLGWMNPAIGRWTKYTVAATAFTAAATSEDVELFSLPGRETIHAVVIKHTTAFSGGTLAAMTLTVGITGTLAKYAAVFDVFQATGDTVFAYNNLPDTENFGAATSIRAAAVSTGDTLDNVGTGSADIWVLTSLLPV